MIYPQNERFLHPAVWDLMGEEGRGRNIQQYFTHLIVETKLDI
jgi:hypothetical protein